MTRCPYAHRKNEANYSKAKLKKKPFNSTKAMETQKRLESHTVERETLTLEENNLKRYFVDNASNSTKSNAHTEPTTTDQTLNMKKLDTSEDDSNNEEVIIVVRRPKLGTLPSFIPID